MGNPYSRRRVLGAGGGVLTAALAGCTSLLPEPGSDGSGSADEPTLQLRSLEVGGSPGGMVDILPTGKVVLLDFFATWCAPCKPEMANLRAVREQFDDSVFIVSITQETDEDAIRDFWTEYEGTWPVVMDPDLKATQKYGARNIPTIIVLTPEREVVWRHTGLAGEEKIAENVQKALDAAGE